MPGIGQAAGITLAGGIALKIGKGGGRFVDDAIKNGDEVFQHYDQARNAALLWLEKRGFQAQRTTVNRFGPRAGSANGMRMNNRRTGFRVEYDPVRGPHINVFDGRTKGPHFLFGGTEKNVLRIQRRFRRR